MNKNDNVSNLDIAQMQRKVFDESQEANRVVIVGSDFSELQRELKASIIEAFKNIELPNIVHNHTTIEDKPAVLMQKEVEYREIDRPYVVTEREVEYREIEKPIIVKELQIERVEVPVYIEKVEIKEVQVPVYIEKQMPIPNWLKIAFVSQTIILLSVLVVLIFK